MTIGSNEYQIENILQFNIFCSQNELDCWNIRVFLEGLGVSKAIFFIFSSSLNTCHAAGCHCESHMRNIGAQLNIYDCHYSSEWGKGMNISKILSSIGILHTMTLIPILREEQLIVNLNCASDHQDLKEQRDSHFPTLMKSNSRPCFLTSTPIYETSFYKEQIGTDQIVQKDQVAHGHNQFSTSLERNLRDDQLFIPSEDRVTYTNLPGGCENPPLSSEEHEILSCTQFLLDVVSGTQDPSNNTAPSEMVFPRCPPRNSNEELSPNNSLLQITGFSVVKAQCDKLFLPDINLEAEDVVIGLSEVLEADANQPSGNSAECRLKNVPDHESEMQDTSDNMIGAGFFSPAWSPENFNEELSPNNSVLQIAESSPISHNKQNQELAVQENQSHSNISEGTSETQAFPSKYDRQSRIPKKSMPDPTLIKTKSVYRLRETPAADANHRSGEGDCCQCMQDNVSEMQDSSDNHAEFFSPLGSPIRNSSKRLSPNISLLQITGFSSDTNNAANAYNKNQTNANFQLPGYINKKTNNAQTVKKPSRHVCSACLKKRPYDQARLNESNESLASSFFSVDSVDEGLFLRQKRRHNVWSNTEMCPRSRHAALCYHKECGKRVNYRPFVMLETFTEHARVHYEKPTFECYRCMFRGFSYIEIKNHHLQRHQKPFKKQKVVNVLTKEDEAKVQLLMRRCFPNFQS